VPFHSLGTPRELTAAGTDYWKVQFEFLAEDRNDIYPFLCSARAIAHSIYHLELLDFPNLSPFVTYFTAIGIASEQ